MKYNIAMVVLVVLGAVLITDCYIESNRDKQNILLIRATVSAMSPQKLAAGISNCEPVRTAGEQLKRQSTFCAEINRVLDGQRLELVDVRPMTIYLPLSVPPLRLRKVEIAPVAMPMFPDKQVAIFDLGKVY